MTTTVILADGSEQTLDLAELRTTLAAVPLEISLVAASTAMPAHLRSLIPHDDADARTHRLVVYPGAANLIDLTIQTITRPP